MSTKELAQLKEELGTDDFSSLTEQQQAIIYEKISKNKLSEETIAAVIEAAPTFATAYVDTIKTISRTASSLSESHKHAFDALKRVEPAIDVLKILAEKSETPEERMKLASDSKDVVFKICDTTASIQKENNKAVQDLLNSLGFLALALLAGCIIGGLAGVAIAGSPRESVKSASVKKNRGN